MTVLERVDPARNLCRFYALTIEPTLFADVSLVREWGRIGARRGQRIVELHADQAAAEVACRRWSERKRRRGYA